MLLRAALLALVACNGKDDAPPPPPPLDTTPAECEEDSDCTPLVEICDAGECRRGDRDDDLASATPLALGEEERLEGVIFPDGDVDWYVYEADAPQWVSVRSFPTEEPTELDTFVSVYDADGNLHAAHDAYPAYPYQVGGTLDGEPVSYDSVVYAYLPESGSWYVTVEDVNGAGDRQFGYGVLVREAVGVGETDALDDPGAEVDLADGDTVFAVGVVLEEPGDSDFVEVDLGLDGVPLEVWSASGLAGSDATARVRVHDGTEVVADKDDDFGDEWLSWVQARAGTFVVEATDASGGGSTSHWFPLFFRTYDPGDSHPFFGTNVYEPETEPNDDETAAFTLTGVAGATSTAFRSEGRIDVPGDTDWWTASAQAGETVSVRCWTDRFGSLASLEVALVEPGGNVFAGPDTTPETVDGDDGFYVVTEPVPAAGPFHVRVGGDGTESGADSWYRCATFVFPAGGR